LVSEDVYRFNNPEELIGGIKELDDIAPEQLKTGKRIKKFFLPKVGFATETIFQTLTSMHEQPDAGLL
jgi:hypothetical protein